MIVHSWRHATPAHRIDHDTAQWFPFISLFAHRGGSRLVRVKAAESTYPDISQGLRTLSSREEHRVTSCLQVPSSNRTVPGYSRCWELRGKCSYSRTLLLSHTHQTLISSTTVERTAHGGIGGHAAHCSFTTTGARSWNSVELSRPVNAYAPNQHPNEAERIVKSGDATQALSGSCHSATPDQKTLRWTLSPSLSTALASMQAKVHADREGSTAYKFCL